MAIQNITGLKTALAEGAQLAGQDVNEAIKILIAELETARRKISDLESRVRSVEMRR